MDDEDKYVKRHHAHYIVRKIKEKRIKTLILKIPKNSVLKIVSKFEDNFNTHKDSERKVLAEIVYEDFHQKYGLQNVAELKLKRFLKAIRVYGIQDKGINEFGVALGVIENKKTKEVINFEAKDNCLGK